jgi:hypothetical protein
VTRKQSRHPLRPLPLLPPSPLRLLLPLNPLLKPALPLLKLLLLLKHPLLKPPPLLSQSLPAPLSLLLAYGHDHPFDSTWAMTAVGPLAEVSRKAAVSASRSRPLTS